MREYVKFVLGVLIFGTTGVLSKYISLPSAQIVVYRTFTASLLLTAFLYANGRRFDFTAMRRNRAPLLFSGLVLGVGWLAFHETFKYAPVSIAMLINYLAPAIVIAASPFVLRERFNRYKAFGVGAATLGMVLVTGRLEGAVEPIGLVFAFASAAFYALLILANKKIQGVSGLELTIVQLALSGLVMLVYTVVMGMEFVLPTGLSLAALVVLSIVNTAVGCYLFFSAMNVINAQSAALLSYIDPLTSLVLSALILGERLSAVQWVGAVLIFGGAILGQVFAEQFAARRVFGARGSARSGTAGSGPDVRSKAEPEIWPMTSAAIGPSTGGASGPAAEPAGQASSVDSVSKSGFRPWGRPAAEHAVKPGRGSDVGSKAESGIWPMTGAAIGSDTGTASGPAIGSSTEAASGSSTEPAIGSSTGPASARRTGPTMGPTRGTTAVAMTEAGAESTAKTTPESVSAAARHGSSNLAASGAESLTAQSAAIRVRTAVAGSGGGSPDPGSITSAGCRIDGAPREAERVHATASLVGESAFEMPRKLTHREFLRLNPVYIPTIDEGFRDYRSEMLEGERPIRLALNKYFLLDGFDHSYADLYYGRLSAEERGKVERQLAPHEIRLLRDLNQRPDELYIRLTPELFELCIKLSLSESLFSSFYFNKSRCCVWGNYGQKFPIFFEKPERKPGGADGK